MSDTSRQDVRAVVLAGGRGTRLKPLTAVFPKPLVPLGDKPILEILLRRLANLGFKDVTLCTGHLPGLIRAVCEDGAKFGLNLEYAHEDVRLGTAGPLAGVRRLTDPFIVMNGDLLTTLNFNTMLDYHARQNADITVGVYRRDVKIDFGVVQTDSKDEFIGFQEKPTHHFEVSMGVNVIGLPVLEHVRPGEYFDMPDLIMRVHGCGGKISCYREDCYWLDIGRMDDYALAQEEYAANEKMFLGEPK